MSFFAGARRQNHRRGTRVPPTIAFNEHQLHSVFQPIYAVRESQVAGYEGLLRATAAPGRTIRIASLIAGLEEAEIVSLDRTARTLHMRDRKSTRLNSSHPSKSRMPSSA